MATARGCTYSVWLKGNENCGRRLVMAYAAAEHAEQYLDNENLEMNTCRQTRQTVTLRFAHELLSAAQRTQDTRAQADALLLIAEIHKQWEMVPEGESSAEDTLDAAQRAADLYRQCGDCAEAKRGIALAREEADQARGRMGNKAQSFVPDRIPLHGRT